MKFYQITDKDISGVKWPDMGVHSFAICEGEPSFLIRSTIDSQLLLYRTRLYRNSRTYQTENFSPAQKQLTVCLVQSGIRIYRISFIPDSKSQSQPQSGIRAIDCISELHYNYYCTKALYSAYIASLVYQCVSSEDIAYSTLPARYWQFALGALIQNWSQFLIKNCSSHLIIDLMIVFTIGSIYIPTSVYTENFDVLSIKAKRILIGHLVAVCLVDYGSEKATKSIIRSKLLQVNFLLFIGDISYSLYLWHWPLLSLFEYTYTLEDDPLRLLYLFIFALAVAKVSRRLLEEKLIAVLNFKLLFLFVAGLYTILVGVIDLTYQGQETLAQRLPYNIRQLYFDK